MAANHMMHACDDRCLKNGVCIKGYEYHFHIKGWGVDPQHPEVLVHAVGMWERR
eukprot:CAMPEP_0202915906 /NCGR_PEP_ID=MMETSP1392-20130828/67035_1 /ASSEMBLY_ACC=CAM_ASM_000868 /TAXON_ID=225041 /ORGANISM="Chlamydomonas chlamydogama, Strain SAG 11-48b" /LENGTH=53 /DNA_ID=CAMNT_0049608107 /DNA_START=8 /DNA_END=169 /DNA_ORIENTATION=-